MHSDLRGSVRNWVSWRAVVGSRHHTLCCQTETNYLQRCRDLGQGKSLELGLSEAILWPCAVLAINLWHLWFLVGNFHSRKAIAISILSWKCKDWFDLECELLFFFFFSSLPWSQPFEGNFEVRLFPLSLFYLLEVNEQHKGRGHSLPVPKLPENILVLSFQFVMGVFKNYVLICPVWAVCSVSLCLFFDLLGVSLLNLQKVLWVTDEDPHINLHLQSFILEVFQSNGCMCLLLSRIPSALITQ